MQPPVRAAIDNARIGRPPIEPCPPRCRSARGALLGKARSVFFLLSRSLSRFSSQIAAVAIGWQVYALTDSAFDLGMVGLVQFLPDGALGVRRRPRGRSLRAQARRAGLPTGRGADRAVPGWGSLCRLAERVEIFVAAAVFGTAGAFESPATAALLPRSRRRGRCSARPRCPAAPHRSRRSPGPRSAASPMRSRPACRTASWWCSG